MRQQFFRFLASGGLNTALTYLAYLLLLPYFHHFLAFSSSFVLGIILSYCLNAFYVFKVSRKAASMLAFPLIYVFQYLLGLLLLWLGVDMLSIPAPLGPLLVVAVTVPLTFVMSRFVFLRLT